MINNYVEYLSKCTKLQEWTKAYHEGKPEIADEEFDLVRRELQDWEALYPLTKLVDTPTEAVGYIAKEDKQKDTKHSKPMLSLENALDRKEAQKWIDTWERVSEQYDLMVVGEFKYNGMAGSVTYIDGQLTRAMSRGDGEYGKDITARAMAFLPSTIQAKGVVEIRGEIILDKFTYQHKPKLAEYANPLAATVAIIRSGPTSTMADFARCLSFVPYDLLGDDFSFFYHSEKLDMLRELEFDKLTYTLSPVAGIHHVFDSIRAIRDSALNFEIDGVVFKINSLEVQAELGSTAHHPLHSFAYKFPPQIKNCEIREVVFQVGRTGEVSPVAKITPTALMGVVVTSVSLHNEERMQERQIAIGNTYEVFRSGDVIPHLGRLVATAMNAVPVVFPKQCPSCGGGLVKRGATYYCENPPKLCKAQLVGGIAYAVSREVLNIDDLAEQTIRLLVEAGLVNNTADLFRLTKNDIASLEGYSDYSAKKLHDTLRASTKQTLDVYIAALGISGVAKTTSRKVAKALNSPETLFELTSQEAVLKRKIPTVGPETARSIANYFSDEEKAADAKALYAALSFPDSKVFKVVPHVTGKCFVFTGSFTVSRMELEAKVLAAGGEVTKAITGKADYLVAGDNAGSKLQKATALNIEVIDERVFLSLFEVANDYESLKNFKQLENGLYVGYHVEGSETFDLSGNVPLTMETLHDGRPLFLSYSKEHWISEHLPEGTLAQYEIHFVNPKVKQYSAYAEYQKINPCWDEKNKVYISTPALTNLISQGYHMFSVGDNEIGEIPESFIINPTHYVKNIVRIS